VIALLLSTIGWATGCTTDQVDGDHGDAAVTGIDAGAPADAHVQPDAQGDDVPCDMDLTCAAPAAGKTSICGRLVDTETSAFVTGAEALLVQVSFYDMIEIATDVNAVPRYTVFADACGRFDAHDATHDGVPTPDLGYVGIAVDDRGASSGVGDHALTVVDLPVAPNATDTGVHAYVTRNSTMAAWSGARSPTLLEQGALLGIFIDKDAPATSPFAGTPREGVKVTLQDSTETPGLYFGDTSATARTTLGPAAVTGVNGSALWVGTSFNTGYGGAGGGPSGCTWPTFPASTASGALWVQEIYGTCP